LRALNGGLAAYQVNAKSNTAIADPTANVQCTITQARYDLLFSISVIQFMFLILFIGV